MSYFRNLTTSLKGGRFLRGKVGRLSFSVIDRGRTWKEHMEIMNKENEWDNMTQADAVEGPIEMVTRGEIVKAMGKVKSGKAAGPSEVSLEMITSSGVVEINVMMELCQQVLDGRGMPEDWKMSVVIPIFKLKEKEM